LGAPSRALYKLCANPNGEVKSKEINWLSQPTGA
jgi:hypothetical protein